MTPQELAELDLKVAEIVGREVSMVNMVTLDRETGEQINSDACFDYQANEPWEPSTNWSQGGPLLVKYWDEICYELSEKYSDAYNDWPSRIKGKEFLIAAMKALTALGE